MFRLAHELAHSWTGNLVSNANAEHFWLNEGFTVFAERRILSVLKGAEVDDFLSAYTEEIRRHYPVRQDGKVLLRFPRLFIVARR